MRMFLVLVIPILASCSPPSAPGGTAAAIPAAAMLVPTADAGDCPEYTIWKPASSVCSGPCCWSFEQSSCESRFKGNACSAKTVHWCAIPAC